MLLEAINIKIQITDNWVIKKASSVGNHKNNVDIIFENTVCLKRKL